MKRPVSPGLSRKLFAGVLIAIGLLNIIANLSWLASGDIHRPQMHVVMRGGWYGFWFSTILFSTLFIIGTLLFMTPEQPGSMTGNSLSDRQKIGIQSVFQRVKILTLTYGLCLAAFLYAISVHCPWAMILFFTLMYIALILGGRYWFLQRCPSCGYRLFYANRLIFSAQKCPQCQNSFK